MRQSLRPCADTSRSFVDASLDGAAPVERETRSLTVLPLAMTAVFVWGVILPLELAVHLLGSA